MSHPLRVGVVLVQNLPWEKWRERALEVEQLGYDGLYVWDHLVHRTQPREAPLFDGLTLLAAIAVETSRVRLGTLVASPTIRHPVLLAKQALTIDQVSSGRLELGIGAAGVLLDYQVLGIEPWSKSEQVERFQETVEIVDATLRGAASYAGRHYAGEGVTMAPGCVQQPRPPLTLAAHGPRTMRIAARHADCWNTVTTRDMTSDEVLALARERGILLDRLAAEEGRDPADIRRSVLIGSDDWPALASVASFRDAVLRYREVGISEIVLIHPDHPAETLLRHGEAAPDVVRRIAEELLPDLRREVG
ncbi:MAG TPA: LLM class flavin-dependent oxidoreductase [Mycobacteriales bacterium]|nr:LLM class flavin-dependent oxidoreductase [Mycobacteriales bacterium]